jgi:hypothetical protein
VIRVLMASLAPKSLSINAGQDGAVFADFGNRKIFIVDEKNKSASGAPVMSIEETGETRVNDGREERLVRILVGGTPSSEVWITDPENLDGGPEFMQVLSELQDLFQDLAGDFMTDGQIGVGDTDIFLGG